MIEVQAFDLKRKLGAGLKILKDDCPYRYALVNLDAELVSVNLGEWVDVVAHSSHAEQVDLIGCDRHTDPWREVFAEAHHCATGSCATSGTESLSPAVPARCRSTSEGTRGRPRSSGEFE